MSAQIGISPRAWAELGLLSLIWGGSFLTISIALREIGFVTSVAHRVFWAALVLWLVVLVRRERIPRDIRTWLALFAMGLLNNVIPFSLMAWGQLRIESGLASIFNASTAVFGVLLAALAFRDERLTFRKSAGVALGFAGIIIAIGLGALESLDLRSLAQLAVVGGALSYAFAGVWARLKLKGLSPIMAATGMLTGSTVFMLPAAIVLEGVPSFDLAWQTAASVLYYSIVSTALAYLLYYHILAMSGTGNLMLVTLLIPPVAIVLGSAVLDERLAPEAYAGFALLGAGLLVLDGRLERRLRRMLT